MWSGTCYWQFLVVGELCMHYLVFIIKAEFWLPHTGLSVKSWSCRRHENMIKHNDSHCWDRIQRWRLKRGNENCGTEREICKAHNRTRTHKHTHAPVQSDSVVWTVDHSGEQALTPHFSLHVHCQPSWDCFCICSWLCVFVSVSEGNCVCVCVFWCKALHCGQSGASILSQWARAKALDDPELTWLFPLCQCVWACMQMRISVPLTYFCTLCTLGVWNISHNTCFNIDNCRANLSNQKRYRKCRREAQQTIWRTMW